jgi:hypothetical protein
LRAGDEVERGTNAEQPRPFEFVEATCGKHLLAGRAERNEAELGAGSANALDGQVRFRRIGIEILTWRSSGATWSRLSVQTLKLSPLCAADTIDDTASGSDGTLIVMPSTVRLRFSCACASNMSIP